MNFVLLPLDASYLWCALTSHFTKLRLYPLRGHFISIYWAELMLLFSRFGEHEWSLCCKWGSNFCLITAEMPSWNNQCLPSAIFIPGWIWIYALSGGSVTWEMRIALQSKVRWMWSQRIKLERATENASNAVSVFRINGESLRFPTVEPHSILRLSLGTFLDA